MAVKIRLSRRGGRNESRWRVVVTPKMTSRDGRFIEIVGHYQPGLKTPTEKMFLKTDRVQYWLSKGAVPSEVVRKYLGILGILPPVDFSKYTRKKPKGEVAAQPTEGAAPAETAPKAAQTESTPAPKEEQPKSETATETV